MQERNKEEEIRKQRRMRRRGSRGEEEGREMNKMKETSRGKVTEEYGGGEDREGMRTRVREKLRKDGRTKRERM